MPSVRVRENEYFDAALRRFKRACDRAGILTELRQASVLNPILPEQTRVLKPRRAWTHEAVIGDFRRLLGGPDTLREGAANGFTVIHDVWFQKGVPPELWRTEETVNGFDLAVLDEFGVTWLLGWNEEARELVLFAAEAAEGLELTAKVIDRYRARIEGPTV